MFELTIFESAFDNKTHRRMSTLDWTGFVNILQQLSEMPGYKPKTGEWKKGSSLISPAVYKEGSTRSNKSVVKWARWAALDVDDYEGTFEEVMDKYKDYVYICYSTASSTPEHPKFRVVFPLTADIPHDNIKHFWYAINKHFGEIGDPQTKDMSRMYYVPAVYPDAHNFFINHDTGSVINPEALMVKYPWEDNTKLSFFDRLPESMQKSLIARQKEQMTNNQIRWNNYRDCPFINKKLVAQYANISAAGWYHTMYKIMVSIATSALYRKYPITSNEIATLCREIDRDNGGWYGSRPFEIEADRAIEYAYKTIGIV